jgi:hypothetical protein
LARTATLLPGHDTVQRAREKSSVPHPLVFFQVDAKDNSINRFSKINGLSEVGMSVIEYDTKTDKLLVAYNNSNLDILYQNNIHNIDAIKKKDINADKNIYNIYPFQSRFYLSTGMGIIVIDEDKFRSKRHLHNRKRW